MKFATHKYPRGATSLLVVVGLAMLLLVIVTGLTVLSVRESRQALNTDLSNRALAAATATAQDAAQLLNANPNLQVPSCDPTSTAPQDKITGLDNNPNHLTATDIETPTLSNAADNQTSIQCRTITSVASTFTQQINKDKSTEFFTYLPNNTPVSKLKLLWGDGTTDVSSFATSPFPTVWPRLTPAAMEITLVFWPKVAGQPGTIAAPPADGLPVRTVVLLPTQTQTSTTDPSPNSSTVSGVSCGGGKTGVLGNAYSCSSDISLGSILGNGANAANYNIVVKLKSRYVDNTPVQVQFFNTASANPVDIQSSIATIDITAKVGDLYRRIQAQKPVGSNSFIDDVLYSKAKICKNLVVKQDYGLVSDNICP
jgi:hypothetical protein